jgi:hypothetical protein
MPVTIPTPITRPFAETAGASFIEYPIPDVTADPARADFQSGFKPQSMTPIVAGGTPPYGQDVNGILKQLSESALMSTAGQLWPYNATVATAIGGYAKGAVLSMADGTGFWISLVTANTDDPDAGSSQWAPLYRYDGEPITGLTGGIVPVTFLQARSRMLVLTGTLVANLQLELPNLIQEWLVVNATTGLFTTTLRTSGGTGVVIPQGGYSNAVQVYGNGVDIFYSANPISIAASVAPTNNSIPQRDGTGFLYANKFDDLTNMVNTFGARALAASGYYTLPGGFKIQWGTFLANADGTTTVAYPVAFTTFARPVCSGGVTSGNVQDNWPAVLDTTLTNFRVINRLGSLVQTQWIAVGV